MHSLAKSLLNKVGEGIKTNGFIPSPTSSWIQPLAGVPLHDVGRRGRGGH